MTNVNQDFENNVGMYFKNQWCMMSLGCVSTTMFNSMNNNNSCKNFKLDVLNLAQKISGLNIYKLFEKLDSIKSNLEPRKTKLTESEKFYLCLMLCQYSGREQAFMYDKCRVPSVEEINNDKESLDKKINSLRSSIGRDLNTYLKQILNIEDSHLPQSKNGKLTEALKTALKTKGCEAINDNDIICELITLLRNLGYGYNTNSGNANKKITISMTFECDDKEKLKIALNRLNEIAASLEW